MIKPEENIFSGQGAIESLHHYFASCNASKKMVFILVDENTRKYCLPFLIPQSESDRYNLSIIEIHSGEKYKSLDTVAEIWKKLTLAGADRKSVLVNLGGGVLCDLGGFAASCYNRGIETIHIPTTLLAMAESSI
jgi:3-dehydroquinate synthase